MLHELGDIVEYTSRFGDRERGILVRVVRFAHCPGANSITALVRRKNILKPGTYCWDLVGLPYIGTKTLSRSSGENRAKRLAAARRAQARFLVENYPVWRERRALQGDAMVGF